MEANQSAPQNRCSLCGATSYRKVVERDAHGVMRRGDRIVCTGCTREFEDIDAWRQSQSEAREKMPEAMPEIRLSAAGLRNIVQTYRYQYKIDVVVDSLPQPYQDEFARFLHGSARPIGDGLARYAFVHDFERWLATLEPKA